MMVRRDWFKTLSQGAVLAVFESERIADHGYAILEGAYTASEACANAIGQREDGEGFVNAIKGALDVADLNPSRINVVKTHGTGTKSNNMAEKAALENSLEGFIATSLKPKIGHTMGVSGLLETCLLLDSMKQGIVPKIENRTEKDDVFLSEDREIKDGLVLSLAAGMGNVYSAAVLSMEV